MRTPSFVFPANAQDSTERTITTGYNSLLIFCHQVISKPATWTRGKWYWENLLKYQPVPTNTFPFQSLLRGGFLSGMVLFCWFMIMNNHEYLTDTLI
jgi:hypothetical protein